VAHYEAKPYAVLLIFGILPLF